MFAVETPIDMHVSILHALASGSYPCKPDSLSTERKSWHLRLKRQPYVGAKR